MKGQLSLSLLSGLVLLGIGACVSRPVEELALADVAVRAAQKVKADSYAPDLFRKAENNFLRAKKDFNEGYYDSCKKHANEARLLAEQAEFKSLQRQTQLRDKPDAPETAPTGGGKGP